MGSIILTTKTGAGGKRERKEERGGGSWVAGPFLLQRAKLGLTGGRRAKGEGRRAKGKGQRAKGSDELSIPDLLQNTQSGSNINVNNKERGFRSELFGTRIQTSRGDQLSRETQTTSPAESKVT